MNDGGSAFPRIVEFDSNGFLIDNGMTMRDYFAAKAMQGLLASDEHCVEDPSVLATWAYGQADMMIQKRNKESKK